MLTANEITEIFYLSDEFSKEFAITFKKHVLHEDNGKKYRNKPNRLSESEVMTILIAFHLRGMRNLKHFYLFYVCEHMSEDFPQLGFLQPICRTSAKGCLTIGSVFEDLQTGKM